MTIPTQPKNKPNRVKPDSVAVHIGFEKRSRFPSSRKIKRWGKAAGTGALILIGLSEFQVISVTRNHVFIMLGLLFFLFALVYRNSMKSGNFWGVLSISALFAVFSTYLEADRRFAYETEKIITGFSMVTLLLICAAYKLRKFLSPFVFLGKSRNWRCFHVYAGVAVYLLFFFHINFQAPVGFFSNLLFYVLAGFMLSSLFGLVLQRWIPLRLSELDLDVVYEKIPAIVDQLQERVHSLLHSFQSKRSISSTLMGFCEKEVEPFLKKPFFKLPLFFSGSSLDSGNHYKFESITPFLNAEEKMLSEEIRTIYIEKQQLDLHYTLQWVWRQWLWSHIVFSTLLIVLVACHITFILIY